MAAAYAVANRLPMQGRCREISSVFLNPFPAPDTHPLTNRVYTVAGPRWLPGCGFLQDNEHHHLTKVWSISGLPCLLLVSNLQQTHSTYRISRRHTYSRQGGIRSMTR